ncbi:Transcriptional regulator, PadR family [Labilithrix luteola]|uniref:Transcriptional regulator, PadR family n=1 Tax=Labilithrix luteola TaxID=1391654 RepID=A0A0K1Q840_9BACT|nr:PadR family transcriptional regulator [Labilithrix luteola]AKV01894.1 Transcriptional regulator, PadR family [Labilithrix luteola]
MADKPAQRSPLAMVVLALLMEAPMHAYRMHELIKTRGQDRVVNVAARNSVYQTITRLLRDGHIRVQETERDEGRPERVVYQITDSGSKVLSDWLKSMLSTPVREYPLFPAALAFIVVLTPREAIKHLEARVEALRADLQTSEEIMSGTLAEGVPRLFLIEEEYSRTMMRAEVKWVEGLLEEIRDKKLTWSHDWKKLFAGATELPAGATATATPPARRPRKAR